MIGPLFFGLLVALVVLVGFAAVWRTLRSTDAVDARLKEYGIRVGQPLDAEPDQDTARRRFALPTVNRLLAGFGFGPRLAKTLTRANVPLTAAEFAVIMLGAGMVGFFVGTVRLGPLLGLPLGLVAGYAPFVVVSYKAGRRQRAFVDQLPDVLTLLVGALRAGYGLSQALQALVDQLPPPASEEFARVTRAVGFGLSVQQALNEMAERVGTDDLDLVVTAINVQYEMGGNLAQTLDTIGETVRDRIRILREIQVLTAQQRITGYVLAVWPLVVAFAIFLINPGYAKRLLEPGMRWLPAMAVVMQILGFLLIRRIVDIEV
jgi:tight adherence protein B